MLTHTVAVTIESCESETSEIPVGVHALMRVNNKNHLELCGFWGKYESTRITDIKVDYHCGLRLMVTTRTGTQLILYVPFEEQRMGLSYLI